MRLWAFMGAKSINNLSTPKVLQKFYKSLQKYLTEFYYILDMKSRNKNKYINFEEWNWLVKNGYIDEKVIQKVPV